MTDVRWPTWKGKLEPDQPLDLRAVDALLRDLRGEVATDAPDVEPEDAAVALERVLVALRATRARAGELIRALTGMQDWEGTWIGDCLAALDDELARVRDEG